MTASLRREASGTVGLRSLLQASVLGIYVLDAVWLSILVLYVAAGMMLAPFHGDEAMHIYTSRDFATAFLFREPERLLVNPPYDIDSDARLRLLNGSVMRYSVGLSWQLAGLSDGDLPPHPGWDWGMFYDQNVATGHRPPEALLSAARRVAVVYLSLSIVAIFGIGWQLGGRTAAYVGSFLYVVNPIILLNGRRALVESALLGFGLLTIWVALQIVSRQDGESREHTQVLPHGDTPMVLSERGFWRWWVALIIVSALTLASKYSGTIFVAGAFGGIFAAAGVRSLSFRPLRMKVRQVVVTTGQLAVSGVLTLLLLVALSPALWTDPVSRARDLGAMLQEQVDIVVSILPDAPTTVSQRIEGIFTQPFIAPVAYFEQASWAEAAPITQEIAQYQTSPLSGLAPNLLLGLPLTLLAGVGLVALWWRRLRSFETPAIAVVVAVWLLVTVVNLLINPLPWQRYYLVLIPIMVLLVAVGTTSIMRFVSSARR